MSLLSDLPDDILNLISFWLNGFDNCFLWMASDSKLRQRLVNNVITDFYIEYSIPGRYLWPGNFLKKLQNLSRLSLIVKRILHHLPIKDVEIFPIPTLKYLKLDFANASEMFNPKHSISSNNPTGPTTSSDMNYMNLNDFYSNLEHLEIISPWFKTPLSIDFLGFLPQNLKTLLIPNTPLTLDKWDPTDDFNANIEMLPRNLTELCIKTEFLLMNEPCLDFSKLPPNLTSLSLHARVHLDKQSYHMIPKNLKKFVLSTGVYNLQELSPYLPSGLESLTIQIDNNSPTDQTFARFNNLQDLTLWTSYDRVLPDDWITNCPPKLKKFESNNLILTGLPDRLFNDCLTTLVLHSRVGMNADFISSFPQSLTNLKISQPEMENPFPFFSLLPKKLKSLETDFDVVENTSLLPETLTYLSIVISIDGAFFDQLPPKLETLIVKHNLPRPIIPPLPTSLTHLSILCDHPLDSELTVMLPRGLKGLLVQNPDNFTDADLIDLPPSLETLSLRQNKGLTDNVIPFLPRCLVKLRVDGNSNFTDECINHLPRNLISLQMNNAEKITSNSCKDLPRYLKELLLRQSYWDPNLINVSNDELPPFMENISLKNLEAERTWNNGCADYNLMQRNSFGN